MKTFAEWLVIREGSLGLKRRERVAAGLRKRADRERMSPGSDPSLWDDAAETLGRFDAAAGDQQRRMVHGMWRKDAAARPGWLRRAVGRVVGMQEPERMPDDGDIRAMGDLGRAHSVVSAIKRMDGSGRWYRNPRAATLRGLSSLSTDAGREYARSGSEVDREVADEFAGDVRRFRGGA